MIVDEKKKFLGGKTKSFENLIFSQRYCVCWWNLHLNIYDCLSPFMPGGKKGHTFLNRHAAFRWRFV